MCYEYKGIRKIYTSVTLVQVSRDANALQQFKGYIS